jgi:hypothetical protein
MARFPITLACAFAAVSPAVAEPRQGGDTLTLAYDGVLVIKVFDMRCNSACSPPPSRPRRV